jgi:hypothetical protein
MRLEHTQRGYTLLEFLLFTTVFAIIMSAIYMMYSSHHTTFTRGKSEIDVHQHGRVALEKMAMEIRMAGYDPSTPPVIPLQGCCGLPTTAIQTMTGSDIIFIADVEGTDGYAERVRYYRNVGTSQIRREIQTWNVGSGSWNTAATSDMADKVNSLTFTYIDGSDLETVTAANVRRVTIQAILQGTGSESTALYQLATDVRLRNL